MSWHIIRSATDEDRRRLREAAQRFTVRHGLYVHPDDDPVDDLEQILATDHAVTTGGSTLYEEDLAYLRRYWRRAVQRALRDPAAEGIAYGYVGRSAQ